MRRRIDGRLHTVTLALSVLLALAGCGRRGAAASPLRLLPEGSTGVAVVHVKRVLRSPLFGQEPFRSRLERARADGDFRELVEAGIDPFTNVDTVVLAGDPAGRRLVAIFGGSFDAGKAAAALNARTGNLPHIQERHRRVAAAVGPLVVLGTSEAVASARAGKGIDGSPVVKELLGLVDRSRPIYAVATVPPELRRDPTLRDLVVVAGALEVSAGLDLRATGRFASPESAVAAERALDGLLELATARRPSALASALEIRARGSDLIVTFALAKDGVPTAGMAAELLEVGLDELRQGLRQIVGWLLLRVPR